MQKVKYTLITIAMAAMMLSAPAFADAMQDASAASARGDYAAELKITRPLAAEVLQDAKSRFDEVVRKVRSEGLAHIVVYVRQALTPPCLTRGIVLNDETNNHHPTSDSGVFPASTIRTLPQATDIRCVHVSRVAPPTCRFSTTFGNLSKI